MHRGKIIQVVGVVIDVEFDKDVTLPAMYDALTVQRENEVLTLEVAQHLSESVVRAIAMSGTDGLKRGDEVVSTGAPIQVPVGDVTQGRMFNVTGEAIDGKPQLDQATLDKMPKRAIFAPSFQETSLELRQDDVLETGLKVLDFFTPFVKGRKIGIVGGAKSHTALRP